MVDKAYRIFGIINWALALTTPKISLIASASRPENWAGLYESIGENDVEFELVFVGPNSPKQKLPDNFHYIKSNVKPAQCFEIAAKHAAGELIMWFVDDARFITEHPLDKLYRAYLSHSDEKIIMTCEYHLPDGYNRYYPGKMDSPMMALCGLLSKSLWRDIGGIDRRFIALCWDMDLVMRVLAKGGKVETAGVFMDERIESSRGLRSRGSTLLKDHMATDRVLVDELWVRDGKLGLVRSSPVLPFMDLDIMTRSQAPTGRWRYQSNLINRFLTSKIFYSIKYLGREISGRTSRFQVRKISTYVRRLFGR